MHPENTQRVPPGGQHLVITEESSEEGEERDPVRVLTDGLGVNGPTPSPIEVEATIARARKRGIDGTQLLALLDEAIRDGATFPSDLRKIIDTTHPPTPVADPETPARPERVEPSPWCQQCLDDGDGARRRDDCDQHRDGVGATR